MDACGNRLRGPPGDIRSPYQKLCFTPAYATPGDSTFTSCVSSYAATGSCVANAECARGGQCRGGACTVPADAFAPVALSTVTPSQLAVFNAAVNSGASSGKFPVSSCLAMSAAQSGKNKLQCKHALIETVIDGRRNVMCPIAVAENINRNCRSAVKSTMQCDRFKARGDLDGYNKCQQLSRCFQFDIVLPDGNTIPIAVKANDMCLAAGAAVLQQAAPQCVNGQRTTCATKLPWN